MTSPRKSSPSVLMSLAPVLVAAGAIIYMLYLWLPYATGYADTRVSILTFANRVWSSGEDWQHCYLVPFAFAAMVYFDRRRLLALPVRGAWAGLILTLFALAFYWAGYRVDNIYVGFGSFQLLLAGLILWLLGWRWMKALFFPWAFLVFLYPLPFLDNFIAFPLRMVMSNASVVVLDAIGVDVVRQGTGILSAPDTMLGIPAGAKFRVDVADPCSGIRSLFALMMVSALYAHFTLKEWWQKIILIGCSIPLAVVGNLVRILTLTICTIAFGSEFAIGKDALSEPSWFHMGAGYLVFVVALLGMIVIAWLLTNGHRLPAMFRELRRRESKESRPPTSASPSSRRQRPQDEY